MHCFAECFCADPFYYELNQIVTHCHYYPKSERCDFCVNRFKESVFLWERPRKQLSSIHFSCQKRLIPHSCPFGPMIMMIKCILLSDHSNGNSLFSPQIFFSFILQSSFFFQIFELARIIGSLLLLSTQLMTVIHLIMAIILRQICRDFSTTYLVLR